MKRCLPGLALIGLGAAALPSKAEDYLLGQGLPLGDFVVAGYANVVAEWPKGQPSALSADDLSLFVSGQVNRWLNPFIEAEITGATLLQEGGRPMHQGKLVAERVYDDIRASEQDTLRVGKMLTPVGDWNLVHAAPLVATTTRPLTTSRGFAEYVSGLSWIHDPGRSGADWQVYAQPGQEWMARPGDVTPRHFRNVWGGHVNWKMGISDKIGLSFQRGQVEESRERYTLLGANARATYGRLKLESEGTWSRWAGQPAGERGLEWGAYVLGDYLVAGAWHAIAEVEHFQERPARDPSNNVLAGLAWKPHPAVVWKLEYVHQTGSQRDIPTGWVAGFSVLF